MKFENKGMLGPFTITTSFITGALFALLGSLIALNIQVANILYLEGVFLVMFGGFIAHWILAHSIHDLIHLRIEKRNTFSVKTLKILLIGSIIILLFIAIYLSWMRGWPVMIFAIIGGISCFYADGYIHHESQMAFGSMFLVLGSFYVQVGTLDLPVISWMKVICMSLFAFFSQYGWLLFYRLDDYGWSSRVKNMSILVTKSGLFFLILYFLL